MAPLIAVFEPATYIIMAVATMVVAYGSKRSINQLFNPTTQIDREIANQPGITMKMAIALPILGSLVLVVLFYYLHILYWFYLIIIAIYSCFAIAYVTYSWIRLAITAYRTRRGYTARFSTIPGDNDWDPDQPVDISQPKPTRRTKKLKDSTIAAIIGSVLGAACVTAWILTGYWLLHDVLALAMAVMMLSLVRLNSIKLSFVLLTLFFLYDIFWVFLSTPIFGKNVMLTIATTISLPVYIIIPRILLSGYSLLGLGTLVFFYICLMCLGDIVLPGLLICFTVRYDRVRASEGHSGQRFTYFRMTLIGYIVGIFVASLVAILSGSGQPALLYLVPTTLGSVVVRAWRSGELKRMWIGLKRPQTTQEDEGSDDRVSEEMEVVVS